MPENSFEREVLDRLIKIESKIESWDNNKKQIHENQTAIIKLQEQNAQQGEDIKELQDRNKWMSRTSTGAAISAVITAVIAALVAIA